MTAPRVTIYTLSGLRPAPTGSCFDRLLLQRTGGLTVPQIMIDDVPIGGALRLAAIMAPAGSVLVVMGCSSGPANCSS